VVRDADLEYEPRQYGRLLEPLRDGRADVADGNRFGRGRPPGMRLRSYLANRVLSLLSNATTGLHLADMETCYKAFRRDVLARIHLREDRFGFEPEVTSAVAAAGARVVEVPITYLARSKAQGKKIGFRDGLRAVWCILRYAPLWRRR